LTHVEEVFRAEYGRVVAGLVRRFGDIDLAEEALADALLIALERWPRDGVPPSPAACPDARRRTRHFARPGPLRLELRSDRGGACAGPPVSRPEPAGPYQIQAAINALHTDAPDASSVDWSQVVVLYDQLAALTPSPIVALNRAVAVAELDGPQVALAIVDDLDLGSYHAFHATRADLLRRLGRYDEAREAYGQAIALTENEAERAWLAGRQASCG
jgi:predicted RNA polymerase sigma factor